MVGCLTSKREVRVRTWVLYFFFSFANDYVSINLSVVSCLTKVLTVVVPGSIPGCVDCLFSERKKKSVLHTTDGAGA